MKKITSLFAAILWLSVISASAHQPDISSFTLVEQQPGHWMLQLNASMTAFQYEVRNAYGEGSYATPEEFNELLLSHLKEQIAIKVNGADITLANGLVMLGHATTVAFELSEVPESVDKVFVKSNAFANVHHSQAIFSIVKEGFDKSRFVLSESNNYELHVSLKDNQVMLAETAWNANWTTLAASLMIATGIGLFLYRTGFIKIILSPKRIANAPSDNL